jgi:uroporphyrinogen III methyltransferase/synthase
MRARFAFSKWQEDNLTVAEDKPLAGKRVVITRSPQQAREMLQELTEAGAEPLLLPCVAFSPASDPAALDDALRSLAQFEWVIFTSQNAIEACAQRADSIAVSLKQVNPSPSVAAVGPATANAAIRAGFRVDVVAKQFRGEELAAELGTSLAGKRVFLPRSNCAGPELPSALTTLGANVTEVIAYENGLPKTIDRAVLGAVRSGKVDVVTFFSPSAFRNLTRELGLESMRQLTGRVALAAIGPVTAKAMQEDGLGADIVAEQAEPSALIGAIREFFCRPHFGSAAP